MTLVSIGPVTNDLIISGENKQSKTGGACYFQSFVFEKFFNDYLIITNCGDDDLIKDFPNSDKVELIKKADTHYFINEYPDISNRDVRIQSTNFANIPITKNDLEDILPDNIDAFILNPLNRYDFPKETVEYLAGFDVPIFISIQGLLRVPGDEVNGNYAIKLEDFDDLYSILSDVDVIFMDESEKTILRNNIDVDELVITNGSHGSRVVCKDDEYKINAVKCDDILDSTGCGDTYMAAYISKKLTTNSVLKSANFASKIASDKLGFSGPYKSDI